MQAHVGQIIPNWSDNRQKVTNGEPEYNPVGEPVKLETGDPKSHLVKYKAPERIQYLNMLTSLQTEHSNDHSRRVRIIRPSQRARRQELWQKRKQQIQEDLVEEIDVAHQQSIEKEAFDNPLQIQRANGMWGGPMYRLLMPPEFTRRMNDELACADIRVRNKANAERREVQQVFIDLEHTMMHVNLPTIQGTTYHSGLDSMVLEQDETPSRVNWATANHVRIQNVMQQLKPYGEYSLEEEYQIDADEQNYVVVTDPGQQRRRNDHYQLHQNHLRFGRNQNDNDVDTGGFSNTLIIIYNRIFENLKKDDESGASTVLAKTTTTDTQTIYSGPSTVYTSSAASTVSHTSESTIIYSEDDDRLYDREQQSNDSAESVIENINYVKPETDDLEEPFKIKKLPRPKAGWDTSPFASFGTIIPPLENSIIFPRPPNHGRLFWFVATENKKHGFNAGVIDEQYLNRIKEVYGRRIQSRQTTNEIRRFLARNPEKMDPNKTWVQCIKSVWKKKFPDSTIAPDTLYQKVRDPKINKDYLPMDQFSEDDFTFLRAREQTTEVIWNRGQHAVAPQVPISNQWDNEQQQRLTNQAYALQAQQQVPVLDEHVLETLQEYDMYVQHFKQNGQAWPRPEGLANAISRMKNIADEKDFEKQFFMTKQIDWTDSQPVSNNF